MSNTSEHYTLAADEGEAIWFIGSLGTIKASGALTGNVMSLVKFDLPPGFSTPLHIHHTEDEAFYILEGTIRGITDDQPWAAEAGSFVWLPNGTRHGFTVIGDKPVRLLAITVPSGFERFVVEAGDPALERRIPPPAPPDIERLAASAAKYGQDILGELVLPDSKQV